MKTQDPIEKTLKERMDNLQRSTDVPSWDQISNSLKRKKQQKGLAWLWTSIGVFVLIAILTFPKFLGDNSSQEQTTEIVDNTKADFEQSDEVNTQSEALTESEKSIDKTSADQNAPVSSNKDTETTPIVDENQNNDFTKGAKTKTTYYYYNSETGEQFSTTDKRVIDSLAAKKGYLIVKDSL